MLDFSNAILTDVAVHTLSTSGDNLAVSQVELDISDGLLMGVLREYFLGNFKAQGFYSFAHTSDLRLNEVYSYSNDFFEGNIDFLELSKRLASHLKHVSIHPNIKEGELYVATFTDMIVEGELVEGIGIFKAESKEKFIVVNQDATGYRVTCRFGTTPRKLDKACVIFNTEKDLGYKLCIIDNTNRDEAKYWVDDFLRAKLRNDDFYQTKQAISLCREFVEEVVKPENNFAKIDQAELLSKTRDFFKVNEVFDQKDFEEEVIQEPRLAEAFRDYKQKFESSKGCTIPDSFKISSDATRQAQKFFKSVIKLDKNFHIYIHGGRDRVERGYDPELGLNYYKLFFDKES